MDNCIISPKTHMSLPDRQLIMTYLRWRHAQIVGDGTFIKKNMFCNFRRLKRAKQLYNWCKNYGNFAELVDLFFSSGQVGTLKKPGQDIEGF